MRKLLIGVCLAFIAGTLAGTFGAGLTAPAHARREVTKESLLRVTRELITRVDRVHSVMDGVLAGESPRASQEIKIAAAAAIAALEQLREPLGFVEDAAILLPDDEMQQIQNLVNVVGMYLAAEEQVDWQVGNAAASRASKATLRTMHNGDRYSTARELVVSAFNTTAAGTAVDPLE